MPVLQKTPLHSVHVELGARLVPFAGWDMPVQYAGVKREHLAVRSGVGIFDVSHMGELHLTKDKGLSGLNRLITNDIASVEVGSSLYTCCCNDQGGVLDDLLVYRIATDEALVVCNASNIDKIRTHFLQQLEPDCVEDESSSTALLALQGPKALSTLAELLPDASDLSERVPKKALRTLPLRLQGAVHDVRVARTGYTGEDGVEIFCDNDIAPILFRELISSERSTAATPCGLAARDTLRLECKMALYGNELNELTTPLEAGLAWCVKMEKPDFVGREALVAQSSQGLTKRLIGFEMRGRGIARAGYAILDADGRPAGVCSSGSPSPSLGVNIGLGFLSPTLSKRGTRLLVDCRGRQVPAEVVRTPFYRRPV